MIAAEICSGIGGPRDKICSPASNTSKTIPPVIWIAADLFTFFMSFNFTSFFEILSLVSRKKPFPGKPALLYKHARSNFAAGFLQIFLIFLFLEEPSRWSFRLRRAQSLFYKDIINLHPIGKSLWILFLFPHFWRYLQFDAAKIGCFAIGFSPRREKTGAGKCELPFVERVICRKHCHKDWMLLRRWHCELLQLPIARLFYADGWEKRRPFPSICVQWFYVACTFFLPRIFWNSISIAIPMHNPVTFSKISSISKHPRLSNILKKYTAHKIPTVIMQKRTRRFPWII